MNIGTMKALHNISFPRQAAQSIENSRFSSVNNVRLNENFKAIADSIYELETALDGIDVTIESSGISGSWLYIKTDDDRVYAWLVSEAFSETITTAAGALYSSEQSFSLPSGLFASIENVSFSVQCASPVMATIKAVDESTLDVYFLATASGSYTIRPYAMVIGGAV